MDSEVFAFAFAFALALTGRPAAVASPITARTAADPKMRTFDWFMRVLPAYQFMK
jgi:hypothetical protein